MKLLTNVLLSCAYLTLCLVHNADIAFYTAEELKESLEIRAQIVAEEISRLQSSEPITPTNQELLQDLYALYRKLQLDISTIDNYLKENSQQQAHIEPLARVGSSSQILAAASDVLSADNKNEAKTFSKWSSFFNRRKSSTQQPVKIPNTSASFPYAIEMAANGGNFAPTIQQQTNGAAATPIILSSQQLAALGLVPNVDDRDSFFAAPPHLRNDDHTNTRPTFFNRIASFFRPPAADYQLKQLKAQPTQMANLGQNIDAYTNFDANADMTVISSDNFLQRLIQHRNNLDVFIKKLQAERNE